MQWKGQSTRPRRLQLGSLALHSPLIRCSMARSFDCLSNQTNPKLSKLYPASQNLTSERDMVQDPSTDTQEFREAIKSSRNIIAIAGAGLSAASGDNLHPNN